MAVPIERIVPTIMGAYLAREKPGVILGPCDTLRCELRGKERICAYPDGVSRVQDGIIQGQGAAFCPRDLGPIVEIAQLSKTLTKI